MNTVTKAFMKAKAKSTPVARHTTNAELVWLLLKQNGPMSFKQVETELDMKASSPYLTELYRRGLVTRARSGPTPGGIGHRRPFLYTAVGMKYVHPAGYREPTPLVTPAPMPVKLVPVEQVPVPVAKAPPPFDPATITDNLTLKHARALYLHLSVIFGAA